MNRIKLGLSLLILTCAVGVLMQSVDATTWATTDTSRSDEAALRAAADVAWSAAATHKDLDAVVSFMTEDGETLPPNEPAAADATAIKTGWANVLNLPDLKLQWEPVRVAVAKSGEIGYTRGTYTMSFTGADGKPVNDHGKYLEVWKKIDGKWKCSSDMYNSDVPNK